MGDFHVSLEMVDQAIRLLCGHPKLPEKYSAELLGPGSDDTVRCNGQRVQGNIDGFVH